MTKELNTEDTLINNRFKIINQIRSLENRFVYHLVLTYKRHPNITPSEDAVNSIFKNFYLNGLLPYLVGTNPSKEDTNPICYAFLDDHTSESLNRSANNNFKYSRQNNHWNRLHHHAVLVIHSSHKDRIDSLLDPITDEGVNTIPKEFSSEILTSYIVKSNPEVIQYASKRLNRFPDYLSL